MKNCILCSVELKFGNTPLFGYGKLKEGGTLCTNCYKKIDNPEISLNLKKYSIEDLKQLLPEIQNEEEQLKKIETINSDQAGNNHKSKNDIENQNKENQIKNTEPKKENKFIKVVFLSLAALLLINWLFHPSLGVFNDPCIAYAIENDALVLEGKKNAWVVLFTKSSDIHKAARGGALFTDLDRCGYQWSHTSGEELFVFGPIVLIFTLLLINFSSGIDKGMAFLSSLSKSKKE